MTNPALAHATDKGRFYADPKTGELLVSVTNVLDHAISKPALVPWAAKVTAEEIFDHLPHYVRRSRADRDGALREAKSQVRVVKDTAADLGTRIHAHMEAHLLGKAITEDDEVAPFAEQALAWLDAWGIDIDRDIEAAECTVANRAVGYAGTCDLLIHLPTGTGRHRRQLHLVDFKTSSTRSATSVYAEYDLQLAAYRHAEVMWMPDGTELPMPKTAGAAILNLRADSHALIPMAASDESFRAFCAAVTVARWLHAADMKIPPLSAPTVKAVAV